MRNQQCPCSRHKRTPWLNLTLPQLQACHLQAVLQADKITQSASSFSCVISEAVNNPVISFSCLFRRGQNKRWLCPVFQKRFRLTRQANHGWQNAEPVPVSMFHLLRAFSDLFPLQTSQASQNSLLPPKLSLPHTAHRQFQAKEIDALYFPNSPAPPPRKNLAIS